MFFTKTQTYLCILFFLIPFISNAQDYNKISIASPNAAALGKFADIPVNYHTGIPQINVPIYTIKEGSLELPISLSYHAGGIKVAEAASWVGIGWALNAGGVITRTVRGIPDEAANTSRGYRGNFSTYGFNYYYVKDYNSQVDGFRYIDNEIMNGVCDGEPDLFFFNFNGHSGQFYFNDDRTPILASGNENLKIDYIWEQASAPDFANIRGFIITTEDGTKYFFGKTTSAAPESGVYPIEMSVPTESLGPGLGVRASNDRVYSSWYLNKIESADKKDVIKLFYEAEAFSTFSWSYFPPVIDGEISSLAYSVKGYSLSRLFIEGVRLSKITHSHGNAVFKVSAQPRLDLANGHFAGSDPEKELANTEAKALQEIVVSDENQVLKKILFSTSYFDEDVNNSTNLPVEASALTLGTDKKRLRLDSITETGNNEQLLKPYIFRYYGNLLPRRLSFGIDHWGFYNGERNGGVIPVLTKDIYTILNKSGANRDSAWPFMQDGALTRIIYPTGGFTDFEFEPNKAKVNAIRYNLSYFKNVWVGYNGGYTNDWPDIVFTGNEKYELTFTNSECGSGINSCTASYRIVDQNGNAVASGSAEVNKSSSFITNIPPGIYTIKMFRDNSTSTKGASLNISKYEPYAVEDPIIGGLRIKTITKNSLEGSSPLLIENYSYEDANRSSGILYERPYYVSPIRNTILGHVGVVQPSENDNSPNPYPDGCLNISYGVLTAIISPSSSLPMQNIQGSHIGYKMVKVTQGANGYSVYRYYAPSLFENNIDDVAYRNLSSSRYCDPKIPNYPAAPLPFSFEKGELQSEYHFDSNSQLLKSVNYKFGYDSTKVSTPGLIIKLLNPNSSITPVSLTEYNLRGYWKKYSIRNETLIDKQTLSDIYTIDTTFYGNANHKSPIKRVTNKSTEENLVTNFKYSFDYNAPQVTSIADGWDTYQSDCNTCNAIYIDRISTPGITTGGKKLAWIKKRNCMAEARTKYIDYRRLNFTNADNAYTTAHLNAKNSADGGLKPLLEMQEQYINAPVETSSWINKNLVSAIFNDYDYESNTNSIFLSKISTVKLNTPLNANFTSSYSTYNTIVKDSRFTPEYLYRSENGNIVEQSKFQGLKDVYLWGYKNKFPVAKISNSDYNSVKLIVNQSILDNPTNDDQLRGELNKLRGNLPNALITTYTYKPLVGMTSITDAKGMTTYYEYDAFQRLKTIKDQNGNILKQTDYHYKN